MEAHYLRHNANVARAMHLLGAEATEAFEGARGKVAGFVKAARPEEIVFTKNASEALNLAEASVTRSAVEFNRAVRATATASVDRCIAVTAATVAW